MLHVQQIHTHTHTHTHAQRYDVMFRKQFKITNSKAMKKSCRESH